MTLEELLASGRLGATPLRWVEPLFTHAERRWTDRELTGVALASGATFVIAVAGALRGGSWKTPLAVGLARALAARAKRACWVGRGFRSASSFEGLVLDERCAAAAGDEAFATFATFQTLRPLGASVIVAKGWRRGLSFVRAPRGLGFAVLDGCRQRLPRGHGRSLVAVDGACSGATGWPDVPGLPIGPGVGLSRRERWLVPVVDVRARSTAEPLGATYDLGFGRPVADAEIADALLVTTHARSERLVEALRRRGLSPRAHLALPDHADAAEVRRALARLSRGPRGAPYSLVLSADKAALALRGAGRLPAPLLLLSCDVSPAPALVDALIEEAGKFCR